MVDFLISVVGWGFALLTSVGFILYFINEMYKAFTGHDLFHKGCDDDDDD